MRPIGSSGLAILEIIVAQSDGFFWTASMVSSEKYFIGGSRFKFAFARHLGLIASISTDGTSTER